MRDDKQYWETEQESFEQAILYTVAWDMERNLSNWEKIQWGFIPFLRPTGQEQILLAWCALEGNTVAQHILSRRFWYTSPEEILTYWGYSVEIIV